jgi:hypothetical protein
VVSRLKINLVNSELVLIGDVESLDCVPGCRVSSLLMKYLGLLLGNFYQAKSI